MTDGLAMLEGWMGRGMERFEDLGSRDAQVVSAVAVGLVIEVELMLTRLWRVDVAGMCDPYQR